MQNYSLNQAYVFLVFVITGVIIGLIFDLFRSIRKTFKTTDIITYIQDILFWVIIGIIVLYNIYKFNSGEIRIFIFVGIIIGFLLYLLSISKYILKANIKCIKILKKIVIQPLRNIYYFIKKNIRYRQIFTNNIKIHKKYKKF